MLPLHAFRQGVRVILKESLYFVFQNLHFRLNLFFFLVGQRIVFDTDGLIGVVGHIYHQYTAAFKQRILFDALQDL